MISGRQKLITTIIVLAIFLSQVGPAIGEVPQSIHYQGRIKLTGGQPLPNGDYDLTLKIWSSATGGTELWSESQTVYVEDSFFDIVLGGVNPIDDDVLAIGGGQPDPSDRFLEITIGTEVLSPRTKLESVPYSSIARRISGDIFTGEGNLSVKNIIEPSDIAEFDVMVDNDGSNLRMIGGGNPDPSGCADISIAALPADGGASIRMVGGGNPDPSNYPNLALSAFPLDGGASIRMIGGGNPDPSDSPNLLLSAIPGNGGASIKMIGGGGSPDPSEYPNISLSAMPANGGASIRMVGGGQPDPGELSFEMRGDANDSARIRIYVDAVPPGLEIYDSSDQVVSRLDATGLELKSNLGPTEIPPIGSRYRNNAIVAWGRVTAGAALDGEFGILSVDHPSTGQYVITLHNSAFDTGYLVPVVVAEVPSIPVTATTARLVTVHLLTPNSFAVYITTGGYSPTDCNFNFMATAR